ncbi:Maltose permease MAL31 [Lasiodiplodia theobromae]|uniref:Maltose permease MAL31 n=1 Tax=Lasiodiplodia theobromae TaxID=45133 RepID=A0A5N5CUK2_9PEZI|nr:Maltose permease MAL31 [Lasiodiplodia theobromae]
MDSEKPDLPTRNEQVDDVDCLTECEDHDESKWEAIQKQPQAFAWCLFAIWITLLVSFENQASGSIIGIPQFRKDFGSYYEGDYVIPAHWQSAFSAAPVASTAIGALMAGQIADWMGRKRIVMLGLFVSYVAITMEFVSTTNQLFFSGKFLNGFAVGTLASVCPTYIGEISPLALRGLFTCSIALAYTVGALTAAIILNSTATSQTRWAYRAVFASQYGFAAIGTIFVIFMPESPWWLVLKGEDELALKSLRLLGCKDGSKRLALIKLTLKRIRRETEGVSYAECFRHSNFRRTIISIAPLSITAFCGVTFFGTYFTYYMQLAGYSTTMSFKLSIALQAVAMLGNVCSWGLVDYVGRRSLTLWGTASLTVILFLIGGLATAATTSAITGAVALIIVTFIFGCFSILCAVYLWFFQVETMGRSYAELDEMFMKRVPARKFITYVSEEQSRTQDGEEK